MKTLAATCILCLVVIVEGQGDWKYPSLSSIPDRRISKVLYKVLPLSQRLRLRTSKNYLRLRKLSRRRRIEAGRLRQCKIQSDQIRDKYQKARWIQQPMLYGFTDAEAANFVQRFDDDLTEVVQASCQNQVERIQRKDVLEMYRNMKRTQCYVESKQSENIENNSNNRRKRDLEKFLENDTKSSIDNITNLVNIDTLRHRSRRNTDEQRTIQNTDGSVTRIRRCVRRGAVTRNGFVRMCSLCHAVTVLPENMYPRYINEVICDPRDRGCLTGGGECAEKTLKLPFRKDTQGLGSDQLSEWTTYEQPIRSSCECGVYRDSVFQYFV
ncbi:uncharacterized protein [Clytia hemisphaerica]